MTDSTATVTPSISPASLWDWLAAGARTVYADFKTASLGFVLGAAVTLQYMPSPAPAPGPGPGPEPPIPAPPQPAPTPPPAPTWGPAAKIVVLYESSKLTGKEVFYSQSVREALTSAVPQDPTTRVPEWRVWDKDVPTGGEPSWADAAAKAKLEYKDSTDPVLYAFDATGAMKSFPLTGLTDADAVAKIQALGAK